MQIIRSLFNKQRSKLLKQVDEILIFSRFIFGNQIQMVVDKDNGMEILDSVFFSQICCLIKVSDEKGSSCWNSFDKEIFFEKFAVGTSRCFKEKSYFISFGNCIFQLTFTIRYNASCLSKLFLGAAHIVNTISLIIDKDK